MGSILRARPARVFVDTSVLFAASLSASGYDRDLIMAGTAGTLDTVVSQFVISETRRNLTNKAPQAIKLLETFLATESVHSVDPPTSLVQRAATIIALKDAPVVAGAVHAGAVALATYDRKHLLTQAAVIQEAFGIIVDTPGAVLKLMGEEGIASRRAE